jgi:SAM-dependent MidA family methyltransferase
MATQQLATSNHNPLLIKLIEQHIAAQPDQRITFAEYMDLALYHPQQGYYATNQVNIGAQGDFFTSPHLGSDFGELLAEQFAQMWDVLGRPRPFHLVEMGAGQGLLVQDIVRYLHRHYFECFDAVEYIIVEKSAALIAEQQQRLQKLAASWGQLRWCTWDDIASDSLTGCCFSNELVDAFPVHQVVLDAGQLREVYVAIADSAIESSFQKPFTEVIGDLSTPQLSNYFELIGISFASDRYADGYRSDVNLAALDWLKTVSDRLHRGYLLTIDYGYPANRYYSPTRSQGTLQCYYQHAHHSDPYSNIGHQDITAHVDFTALERQGEQYGLRTVGFTQQGLFLMALGLGDRLAALSDSTATEAQSINDILRRREALHSLMNPMGLGNFGVLIQSKGLENDQPSSLATLKGLSLPPM